MFECSGCGSQLTGDQLVYPPADLFERLLPGDVMPDGECPNCGELVFKDEVNETEDE